MFLAVLCLTSPFTYVLTTATKIKYYCDKNIGIVCVNVHEAPMERNCNTLGWKELNRVIYLSILPT